MSLFLSRLCVNVHRRKVQHDLADCSAMHRRVLEAFPQAPGVGNARDHFGILYRVETLRDQVVIIVQSATEPDWSRLPSEYLSTNPEVKPIDALLDHIQAGIALRFRLVANPTRRISNSNVLEVATSYGKRVPVLGEEQQLAWLTRKGKQCGFVLLPVHLAPVSDVRIMPQAESGGQRGSTGRVTLGSVRFDGRLCVIDAERFRQALVDGIGSGKAFGMGLLSVAPDDGHA